MKAILFILVFSFTCHVKSTKIRAIRRQWIKYLPLNQNNVPTRNLYNSPLKNQFIWFKDQRMPVYNNKLIYYVDPIGQRYNMFGANKESADAYKAYLNSQIANQAHMYQMGANQVSNSAPANAMASAQSGVNPGYGTGQVYGGVQSSAFAPGRVTAESMVGVNGNNDQFVAQSGVNSGYGGIGHSIQGSWQNSGQVNAKSVVGVNDGNTGEIVAQSGVNSGHGGIGQSWYGGSWPNSAFGEPGQVTAESKAQVVNTGQGNTDQYVAQSGVNSGYGGIGQSVHGSWQNSAFGAPSEVAAESQVQLVNTGQRNSDQLVYQSWQNTKNGKILKSGNMSETLNSGQIKYSAGQNVANSENQGQTNDFVDQLELGGDQVAQLNEESNPAQTVIEYDETLPNIADVYLDETKINPASEASLRDDAKEISTSDEINTNADLSPEKENISTIDQNQNVVIETPEAENVSVLAETNVIENGGNLTVVQTDTKNDTVTVTVISENDTRLTDDEDKQHFDKIEHNESGVLPIVIEEINSKNPEYIVPMKREEVFIPVPSPLRITPISYNIDRKNLYWESKTPVIDSGYNNNYGNTRIYPYFTKLQENQEINRHKSLWNTANQFSQPPYIGPRKIEWKQPEPEIIPTKQENNLISNICQNPNVDVVRVKEGINALFQILNWFGIGTQPRNISKNTEIHRNINTQYMVDEKQPVDYDFINGVISSNLNVDPYRPQKIDLEKNPVYIIRNQDRPNDVKIKYKALKPNYYINGAVSSNLNVNPYGPHKIDLEKKPGYFIRNQYPPVNTPINGVDAKVETIISKIRSLGNDLNTQYETLRPNETPANDANEIETFIPKIKPAKNELGIQYKKLKPNVTPADYANEVVTFIPEIRPSKNKLNIQYETLSPMETATNDANEVETFIPKIKPVKNELSIQYEKFKPNVTPADYANEVVTFIPEIGPFENDLNAQYETLRPNETPANDANQVATFILKNKPVKNELSIQYEKIKPNVTPADYANEVATFIPEIRPFENELNNQYETLRPNKTSENDENVVETFIPKVRPLQDDLNIKYDTLKPNKTLAIDAKSYDEIQTFIPKIRPNETPANDVNVVETFIPKIKQLENELNIQYETLRPNETPANDASGNKVKTLIPKIRPLKTNTEKQNPVPNSESIKPWTNNTGEPLNQTNTNLASPKENTRKIREVIISDLIGLNNKCNSRNYLKLLEEIKALIDSVQSNQCET